MFGSFFENFGLNFPFFGQIDQQGGMFAQYAPPNPTAHEPGTMGQAPTPPSPKDASAAMPGASAGPSALASPLAPPQPGVSQPQQPQMERRGSFALDQRM